MVVLTYNRSWDQFRSSDLFSGPPYLQLLVKEHGGNVRYNKHPHLLSKWTIVFNSDSDALVFKLKFGL